MGIRGLGNQANTFGNKFVKALGGDSTGTDAMKPFVAYIQASGGTTATPGDGFRYHFFVGPGTFSVTSGSGNVRLLLIGGGGGSGIVIIAYPT